MSVKKAARNFPISRFVFEISVFFSVRLTKATGAARFVRIKRNRQKKMTHTFPLPQLYFRPNSFHSRAIRLIQ